MIPARALPVILLAGLLHGLPARAQEAVAAVGSGAPAAPEPYRTPRAGEAYRARVLGVPVDIPARDREQVLAVSLGSTFFIPRIGDSAAVPFAGLYWRRVWPRRRVRAVLAGLANTVDYAEGSPGLELLVHGDSYTIPFPTTELVDGEEVAATSLEWGAAAGWLGLGYRLPVRPGEVDNALRLEAFYEAGLLYFEPGDDGARPPPDTYVHGLRVRVRLDAMQRNLLELPHRGVAWGADLALTRRDRWRGFGIGGSAEDPDDARDYLKASGYLVVAAGLPGLSERHRLLLRAHGGWAPQGDLDRFSAFRIGGGPAATEAEDLARSPYPGATFDQFPTREYLLLSLEYRLEALFFLYLHLRATLAWGQVPTQRAGRIEFATQRGEAYTVGLTSGFLWDSLLQLEYTFDSGAARAGDDGQTVLVAWSRSF